MTSTRDPKSARRTAPGRATLRMRATAAAVAMAMIAACGGSGGGGGTGPTTPTTGVTLSTQPTPTDKSAAIDLQYVRVAEIRQVIAEMQTGEEAALQALIADNPAEWDRYWEQDYPVLLDKFDQANQNLQASENYIQTLVYGLPPATAGAGTDAKFIPLPIVLVALASITTIVALEKSGYRDRKAARDAAEQASITEQLRQVYVNSGMDAAVADARAKIDGAKVSVLWGLQRGIDKARWFVFENGLVPGFSSLLSEGKQAVVSLIEALRNIDKTKGNVEVIMTTKSCRTTPPGTTKSLLDSVTNPERGGTRAGVADKDVTGCRIYFCTTNDDTCSNLPAGDWEAVVFAPGHLRDVDLDVNAPPDGTAVVQANPVAAADIEDPSPIAQCSSVQNAGGDTADTRTVPLGGTSGSFSLSYEMYGIKDQIRVLYDGAPIFDSGCVSGSETQLIPFSGLANFVTVQVTPNCSGNTSGTAWNYSVTCPTN